MASFGMSIITVIHQPRFTMYELFDTVLYLAVGGDTAYLGPPLYARDWFIAKGFAHDPNENIADFCLDVISGKLPRLNDSFFKKESLPRMWEVEAQAWMRAKVVSESKKDDKVSKRKAFRTVHKLSPEVRYALFDQFDKVDDDNSGSLDIGEMDMMFKSLGVPVSDVVRQRLLL